MKTVLFDFDGASSRIPDAPPERRGRRRDDGRMVVLDRGRQSIEHVRFDAIRDWLREGDLVVFNNSYVVPNTLPCRCGEETANIIVHGHESDGTSLVVVEPAHGAGPGRVYVPIDDASLSCTLLEPSADRLWTARFRPVEGLALALERHGTRTDAPYDVAPTRWDSGEAEAFRAVYAQTPGSLEIPSAGLHFTHDMLATLAAKGIETTFVTLHVAATEILSVRHIAAEHVEDHRVRSEFFDVGEEATTSLSRARRAGRRIVAVGTTVLRTLESLALDERTGDCRAQSGWTDLYIYPGFSFRMAGALLTNLHRPRSTHIVLTAAFAGQELVMRGYEEIVGRGCYEFDMFGDSMLIV